LILIIELQKPMPNPSFKSLRYGILSLLILSCFSLLAVAIAQTSTRAVIPTPTTDISTNVVKGKQTAVLAGGCFWGVEAVFEHVKGVSEVVSGYSGGSATTAQYERVGSGQTGHAEAVKITYDPTQISYGQLLKVYFSVAHDPTQVNRQGPDTGTQYRSAIFFGDDNQQRVARAYIDQLNQAKAFPKAIATQLVPLKEFYAAESYHQNFIVHNPDYPYVVIHDLPKLDQLRKQFPELYKP
jgi:peptide-methionine (S)-S-oxide reductase